MVLDNAESILGPQEMDARGLVGEWTTSAFASLRPSLLFLPIVNSSISSTTSAIHHLPCYSRTSKQAGHGSTDEG